MPHKKHIPFILIFIILLLPVMQKCKKDKNTLTLKLTYSGTLYIDSIISFSSNAPSGSTYKWSFGDGSNSTFQSPTHIFTSMGTYTVTLMIDNDSSDNAHFISKSLTIDDSTFKNALNFTFSGIQCVDSTISFLTASHPGSIYKWNFGDGTTSTLQNPTHIFSDTGEFFISLTLNNDSTDSIHHASQPLQIYPFNTHYTHLSAGTRLWGHIYYLFVLDSAYPPVYYPDTTFTINYIDSRTLSIGANTFIYSPGDTSHSHISYTMNNYPYPIDNGTITYNYVTDSITYTYYHHISAAGHSIDYYFSH